MAKQNPTLTELPDRKQGETDAAYNRRVAALLAGDDIRSKADNREWTGSPSFHLDVPKGHHD